MAVAALCLLGLKELFDIALPLLRTPEAPPNSFTESVPEQDLAWALLRPADQTLDQWLKHVTEPLTPEQVGERLYGLESLTSWYATESGLILLAPPYTTRDEFTTAGIADADLADSLAWAAANDYGWHIFLIDADWNRIDAHVTVQVTLDTPQQLFTLVRPGPHDVGAGMDSKDSGR